MCIGCRMQRAAEWTTRIMHERQMHESNCFITLTYETGKLPPNKSLEHRDYQLFMKRLRQHTARHHARDVRFFMCGEYGEQEQRPHYHACIFNHDFTDRTLGGKSGSGEYYYNSQTLEQLWGHGICSVQDLTQQTASYCARYIMKKALGENADTAYQHVDLETGEIIQRRPEYCAMSLKPGIGAEWLKRYSADAYPHGYTVDNGVKRETPRYYDKLTKRTQPETIERLAERKAARARERHADNTDERLRVRETVHLARVSTLKRGLE